MRCNGLHHAFVLQIGNTVPGTNAFHNEGDCRVVEMADAGKEVVFHLQIQATQVPGKRAVGPREVNGGG